MLCPSLPPSPSKIGGSQGGENMVTPRSQAVLPSLSYKPLPPMNISLALIKSPSIQNFIPILIPSLQTSFTIFTNCILVLCITKNSRNSWHDSSKIIHFFIPRGLINSSTSCLTTLCIAKIAVTCGSTYSSPLTHHLLTKFLFPRRVILVPTIGNSNKSHTRLSKVMWPNAAVLCVFRSFVS